MKLKTVAALTLLIILTAASVAVPSTHAQPTSISMAAAALALYGDGHDGEQNEE